MTCSAGGDQPPGRAAIRATSRAWLHAKLFALLFATVAAAACSDLTGPPFGAVPMQPHSVYALWWEQVEACTGRSGALGDVEWYVMPPGGSLGETQGRDVAGIYQSDAHRIVIAEEYLLNGEVVRHEMLHALVRKPLHEREDFLTACEGVVNCEANCLSEAGPPPEMGPEVPRIPPEDLVLAISVEPAAPSVDLMDGRFMLVVTATNPHPYDVVVTLPPSGDPGPPIAFSFSVAVSQGVLMWYNGRVADAGTAIFTAGQSKRAVFDLTAADARASGTFAPGSYTASGGFSSRPYDAQVPFDILQ